MAKVKVKKGKKAPKGINREKDLKKGDAYTITTDLEIMDIDGDEVKDLVFTHEVLRNGDKFVDGRVVWYGLGEELAEAFVAALGDTGIEDDAVVETTNFREVVKLWKGLTKALAKINKLGDDAADALGEEEV